MIDEAGARSSAEGRLLRWLPLLLVPTSLLTDPAAALPLATYFFRDFTVTFYPLRLFGARELREGRWPFWDPLVFEGAVHVPALYPADLLFAAWPTPAFLSWLLTLHLPLAALAAYWLARELGASRVGGFVSGAAYALAGFALSCLNLYVFLEALALAPLLSGLLRRAAARGGRQVAVAAVATALALSTLAVEFVAQAVVVGVLLGLAVAPSRAAGGRLVAAIGLGVGLAGVPVALVLGLLPDTPRGAGFGAEVGLANAVHPAVLLQVLLPSLFGLPSAPAEAWWGGRFFSKGLPYFLSLYAGPLLLSLAAVGVRAVPRRTRFVLLTLGGLGLWYALGEWGGLAPVAARLPLGSSFRFPSKALLLPHFALALAAGFGADRLLRSARAWTALAGVAATAAACAAAVALVVTAAPAGVVEWSGVLEAYWPHVAALVRREAGVVLLLALAACALAWAVRQGRLRAGLALALLTALAVVDLARAGAGLNRQVHPSFFDPLPEMAAQPLRDPGGARVFSYGLDHSPAFREFLARGGRDLTLASFFVHRQILGPYTNILDEVPVSEASDLTAFAPRPRELGPGLLDPASVDRLVPWLRNAAVLRVLSLDALSHPDLSLLATVAPGPPGLAIHVYSLKSTWPRVHVACRSLVVDDREAALLEPYAAGFEPEGEVVLEAGETAPAAACTRGVARLTSSSPTESHFDVEADGNAYVVVRDSHARGWEARVDGLPALVRRANGKHRAVAFPGGRHRVDLVYRPPGLWAGLALSIAAAAACAGVWIAGPPRGAPR